MRRFTSIVAAILATAATAVDDVRYGDLALTGETLGNLVVSGPGTVTLTNCVLASLVLKTEGSGPQPLVKLTLSGTTVSGGTTVSSAVAKGGFIHVLDSKLNTANGVQTTLDLPVVSAGAAVSLQRSQLKGTGKYGVYLRGAMSGAFRMVNTTLITSQSNLFSYALRTAATGGSGAEFVFDRAIVTMAGTSNTRYGGISLGVSSGTKVTVSHSEVRLTSNFGSTALGISAQGSNVCVSVTDSRIEALCNNGVCRTASGTISADKAGLSVSAGSSATGMTLRVVRSTVAAQGNNAVGITTSLFDSAVYVHDSVVRAEKSPVRTNGRKPNAIQIGDYLKSGVLAVTNSSTVSTPNGAAVSIPVAFEGYTGLYLVGNTFGRPSQLAGDDAWPIAIETTSSSRGRTFALGVGCNKDAAGSDLGLPQFPAGAKDVSCHAVGLPAPCSRGSSVYAALGLAVPSSPAALVSTAVAAVAAFLVALA